MMDDQFTMDEEDIIEEDIFYDGRPEGYRPVSVMGWLGTLALSCLPVINIVMWFIWAFTAKQPSRKTYARALLLIALVLTIAAIISVFIFGERMLEWARGADPDAAWR